MRALTGVIPLPCATRVRLQRLRSALDDQVSRRQQSIAEQRELERETAKQQALEEALRYGGGGGGGVLAVSSGHVSQVNSTQKQARLKV